MISRPSSSSSSFSFSLLRRLEVKSCFLRLLHHNSMSSSSRDLHCCQKLAAVSEGVEAAGKATATLPHSTSSPSPLSSSSNRNSNSFIYHNSHNNHLYSHPHGHTMMRNARGVLCLTLSVPPAPAVPAPVVPVPAVCLPVAVCAFSTAAPQRGYSPDRNKDRFLPARPSPYKRPDEKEYKYTATDSRRSKLAAPALKSNPYNRSRRYGETNSNSSSNNNSDLNDNNNSYMRSNSYGTLDGRVQMSRLGGSSKVFGAGDGLKPIDWAAIEKDLPVVKKDFYQEQPAVQARTVEEIKKLLNENKISIDGKPPIPKPVMTFREVGFPAYIQAEIDKAGFAQPTAIQKIGFPIALSGRDFIGVSRTGSGKTLAFVLPALIHIDAQPPLNQREGPIALVLVPTRELAEQVAREAIHFGFVRQIRTVAAYGGVSRFNQQLELGRGAEIVVACPGRLLDLLVQGITNLKRTSYLVLDEADRMLDMGFEPQIKKVVSQLNPKRQTLMYSATWPSSVSILARDFCRENPVTVKIGDLELHANPDVTQRIEIIRKYEKHDKFKKCIAACMSAASSPVGAASPSSRSSPSSFPKPKILVFCSTRSMCEQLFNDLRRDGYSAGVIHGMKTQSERDRALEEFRKGYVSILVATDVAARGLDVNDISTVVNFDLPNTIEDYVHRIGRTARAGKKGCSVTFYPSDEHSNDSTRMARDICRIMELAGQNPPEELRRFINR